jgi:hypothetical protein
VQAGDAGAVRFLLDSGASCTVRTSDGQTPLDLAEAPAVKALLRQQAPPAKVIDQPKTKKTKSAPSATGGGPPALFMQSPMSAAALSVESGSGTSWLVGGDGEANLCSADVQHKDIATAPMVARDLATQLATALGGAWLPAAESDTRGRVVVITGCGGSGLGAEAKEGMLHALGIQKQACQYAQN